MHDGPRPVEKYGPSSAVYAHLLEAALTETDRRNHATPSLLLRDVVRRRPTVAASAPPQIAAADALTSQISYDVALIRYARCLGIECGIADFDRPADGRGQLERAFALRGIDLG